MTHGHASFSVGSKAIGKARAAAVAHQSASGPSRAEGKLKGRLVDAVEADGGTIDDEAIDVVPLLDGDITLTVPVNVDVDKVNVDIDNGTVSVGALTSESDDPAITASGPGMAPTWSTPVDGQYVITVNGLGDALFTWSRVRLLNDGNSTYDWLAYKRRGDAHPVSKTGLPDPRVASLRIQNYPYDSVEPNLVNWNEWDPASNFSGQCDSHVYNAGVTVLGAGFGLSFQDCDGYEVWRNANKPSSYWLQMDQGVVLHGGSRSIGYALAWKQKDGTAASQHDYQQVNFYWNSNDHNCSHTDAGATC